MLNIDIFTLGNPFKDDAGNKWQISSNFGEPKKIYVEISLVEAEPENEQLKELLKE